MPSRTGWGGVSLLLTVLCASGCGGDKDAPAMPAPPNVLLVSIETLRADHVSGYGYDRRTTPFLDSLAARGLLFENAYATSSWTLPSLASILTSTYGSEHGVGSRGPAASSTHGVPEDLAVLPELLGAHDYRTYGITASLQASRERGFARGFDRYSNPGLVDCREVLSELEPWLPELHAGGRWFLWLHLFDPHGPYRPREPALSEFWPEGRRRYPELESAMSQRLFLERDQLDEDELAYLEAVYDSEIRYADDCFADIYGALPQPEEILVVATSDHGEEFMERGGLLHGQTLHDESVRIPLIVRPPGTAQPGERIERPASLIDVAPTILEAAGVDVPSGLRGGSLLSTGDRGARRRPVYSELLTRSEVRLVTDGRWKLMREGSVSRLFDLKDDPGETVDRSADHPAQLQRLVFSLDRFEEENRRRAVRGLEVSRSAEELEALRALGYLD